MRAMCRWTLVAVGIGGCVPLACSSDDSTDGPGTGGAQALGGDASAAADSGGTNSSGGADADGGTGGTEENLCPQPYRCNPDETSIDGLMREYLVERCDPNTGDWIEVEDCSDMGCSCTLWTSRGYVECSWGGEVCQGAQWTF